MPDPEILAAIKAKLPAFMAETDEWAIELLDAIHPYGIPKPKFVGQWSNLGDYTACLEQRVRELETQLGRQRRT